MTVKLYRCRNIWATFGPRPTALLEGTGQSSCPATHFEDGTRDREESTAMARTVEEGRLMEKAGSH